MVISCSGMARGPGPAIPPHRLIRSRPAVSAPRTRRPWLRRPAPAPPPTPAPPPIPAPPPAPLLPLQPELAQCWVHRRPADLASAPPGSMKSPLGWPAKTPGEEPCPIPAPLAGSRAAPAAAAARRWPAARLIWPAAPDTAGSIRALASWSCRRGPRPSRGAVRTNGVGPLAPSLDMVSLFVSCRETLRLAMAMLLEPIASLDQATQSTLEAAATAATASTAPALPAEPAAVPVNTAPMVRGFGRSHPLSLTGHGPDSVPPLHPRPRPGFHPALVCRGARLCGRPPQR